MVRGEPDQVGEPGGVADHGVEVAALPGLLQARRDAPGELPEGPSIRERPEGEPAHGGDLPGHPGAPIAEGGLGLFRGAVSGGEAPFQRGRGALGGERPAERIRVVELPGHPLGQPEDLRRALLGFATLGGGISHLHGEGPLHAVRLAGVEGEEQAARAKVLAEDGVDQTEADGGRPGGVDAGQSLGRDVLLVARAEREAAQPHLGAAEEEGGQRGARGVGHVHPDGRQDHAEGGHGLVDVARAEELIGRAPAQIERLGGTQRARRGEVGGRRLGASTRVGQRVAELALEARAVLTLLRPPLERELVEPRGAIERERVGGLARGPDRVGGGLVEIARAASASGSAVCEASSASARRVCAARSPAASSPSSAASRTRS